MKERCAPASVRTEFTIDNPAIARNHPAPLLTICSARSFCSTSAGDGELLVTGLNPPDAIELHLAMKVGVRRYHREVRQRSGIWNKDRKTTGLAIVSGMLNRATFFLQSMRKPNS
jgi:hypothetical protein